MLAALCTAEADGSDAKYDAGERRELLVMLRAEAGGHGGDEPESAVRAWLQTNGWNKATIVEQRMLEGAFDSSDALVRACYVNALTSDGGCVIYDKAAEG